MRRVSESRSATSARPRSRSSLSMTARARWRSASTVASRASPMISRRISTSSARPASTASTKPDRAEPGRAREQLLDQARDGQSEPQQHESRQRRPEQRAPAHAPRRARRAARQELGRRVSDRQRPYPSRRCASSGSATTSRGSSTLKIAGLRKASVIAAGPRSGIAARGRGECEAARGTPSAVSSSAGGRKRIERKSLGAAVGSAAQSSASLPNSDATSAGRSPGNTAISVSPSKLRPSARSPGAATPTIDGSPPPSPRSSASRVARTAASAITSTSAPASPARAMARCGHPLEDRLQPVVRGVVQLVGLGRGEQDLVGARLEQRAEPAAPPDPEAVEDRDHRILQVAHRLRPGVERGEQIDQHDLAVKPREMLAEERPHHDVAIGIVAPAHHRPVRIARAEPAAAPDRPAGRAARRSAPASRPSRRASGSGRARPGSSVLALVAAGLQVGGEQPRRLDRGVFVGGRQRIDRRDMREKWRRAADRRAVRRKCTSVSADHCS